MSKIVSFQPVKLSVLLNVYYWYWFLVLYGWNGSFLLLQFHFLKNGGTFVGEGIPNGTVIAGLVVIPFYEAASVYQLVDGMADLVCRQAGEGLSQAADAVADPVASVMVVPSTFFVLGHPIPEVLPKDGRISAIAEAISRLKYISISVPPLFVVYVVSVDETALSAWFSPPPNRTLPSRSGPELPARF